MASSATPPASASEPRPAPTTRLGNFWQRVSEGRRIDDLWSQFAADARSSYGFYGKDVDWDEVNQLSRWKRPFRVAKQLFWAMMNKLTPARRVLFLAAVGLLFISGFHWEVSHNNTVEIKYEFFAALLFLLLLSLELADKITMKRDLEIAREIQAWLVPSTPPMIPNAEVAFYTRAQNSVAGDYYDAFYPTDDAAAGGQLMLVMADVAGKSVPAALLMATLQASLRTIASEGLPLSELAIRLNHYACAHSLVPLGITPEATFPSAEVTLQAGDTLVLFTDGVVEAFNSASEEFSDNRWLNIIRGLPNLNAQQTLQFLMKSVEDFVGATRQSDDITCLVLRCI